MESNKKKFIILEEGRKGIKAFTISDDVDSTCQETRNSSLNWPKKVIGFGIMKIPNY